MIKDKNTIKLLVSGETRVSALRAKATNHLKIDDEVYLDCIGVAANYVATKAIINIQAYLSTVGLALKFTPIFHDYTINGTDDIKTGIRWILNIDNQK